MSNKTRRKVAVVFGTRPEAIKLCPIIGELRRHEELDCRICLTGQHREMVDSVLRDFGVRPDVSLNLMRANQTLTELTSRTMSALDTYFTRERPDVVVVQGDTTTVLATSLTAYYHQIEVAHVEAGLRTHEKYSPFPEEINRSLVAPIADHHFAPTRQARQNLLDEGIDAEKIILTGNTVIDALLWVRKLNRHEPPALAASLAPVFEGRRPILVTGHRRESFGPKFEQMCLAMRDIAEDHDDVVIVYPVHLNPNVQAPVRRLLDGVERVHLLPPQEYRPFAWLMDRCHFALTDSGGVQEEAPALGKPVLVMRETTERPEGIEAGSARLVGCDRSTIAAEARRLLSDDGAYREMAAVRNPYGDGRASQRITQRLAGSDPTPWQG